MPRSSYFIDAEWKRWIAENVLLGASAEDLTRILIQNGFDAAHANLEVTTCQSHPYIVAALASGKKAKKSDWVLETQRRLREAHTPELVELHEPIPNELFFERFYGLNQPLVLRDAVQAWPALTRWTPEFLIASVGDQDVQIQSRREQNENYEVESSQHRALAKFPDFIRQVFSGTASNDIYMTAQNGTVNGQVLSVLRSDLNPMPGMLDDTVEADRLFYWIGPQGTVTPLHHDMTNNLMAQVVGRKRVKLIAPDYLPYVYNHTHCYSLVDPENVDTKKFPLFEQVKVFEVDLGPGDVLFLPIGWWHHVRSLDPSITITATNFRGINGFQEHYPD
jgi:ribosomal protein L16 Arg81 hydroxylase